MFKLYLVYCLSLFVTKGFVNVQWGIIICGILIPLLFKFAILFIKLSSEQKQLNSSDKE